MKIIKTNNFVKISSDLKIQPTLGTDKKDKSQRGYLQNDSSPDGPEEIKQRFTKKKKKKNKKHDTKHTY